MCPERERHATWNVTLLARARARPELLPTKPAAVGPRLRMPPGAGGPDVSQRESLGLLRPDLPQTNLEEGA